MPVVPVAPVEPGQRASVVRRREGGTRKRTESPADHGPVIPGNSDTARELPAGDLDELEAGEIDLAPVARRSASVVEVIAPMRASTCRPSTTTLTPLPLPLCTTRGALRWLRPGPDM